MLDTKYGGKNPANANCPGKNISPALAWARAPSATRSFVILMGDQSGRAGLGVNDWVGYGIKSAASAGPRDSLLTLPEQQ